MREVYISSHELPENSMFFGTFHTIFTRKTQNLIVSNAKSGIPLPTVIDRANPRGYTV